MKLFNKILCLVALCAINSVSAKIMGGKPGYAGGTEYTGGTGYTGGGEPAKKSTNVPLNQYIQTWRTRKGLMDVQNRVVFTNEILSIQNFIQNENLGSDALKRDVFKFILKAIRDSQFKFTGNDAKDLIILQDSNEQIDYLASQLGSIDYNNKYLPSINNSVRAYETKLNAA